jgi:hypothetical protein
MTLLSGSLGPGTGSAGVGVGTAVGTAIASGGGGAAFAHTTLQYSGSIEVKEDEAVCEAVLGGRASNESTFLSSKPPKLILQGNESRNL